MPIFSNNVPQKTHSSPHCLEQVLIAVQFSFMILLDERKMVRPVSFSRNVYLFILFTLFIVDKKLVIQYIAIKP